jgi:maleate isomerase
MSYDFQLIKPDFYKASLGLIVLKSDETIEQEFRSIIDNDISLLHSRIPCHPKVTPETLSQMEIDLPTAAELLPSTARYDVIGYACTSASTIIGTDKIKSLIQSKHTNTQVTDPIDSVIKAMKKLNCKKIAFVSPYSATVTEVLKNYLEKKGFEITNIICFEEDNDSVVAKISEHDTLRAIVDVNNSSNEAVFASCTNLKTFNIINEAEKSIKKPVISSNLALAWNMLNISGVKNVNAPGALFN